MRNCSFKTNKIIYSKVFLPVILLSLVLLLVFTMIFLKGNFYFSIFIPFIILFFLFSGRTYEISKDKFIIHNRFLGKMEFLLENIHHVEISRKSDGSYHKLILYFTSGDTFHIKYVDFSLLLSHLKDKHPNLKVSEA